MKLLQDILYNESLLDDEEDMVNNETAADSLIEDWCNKNIISFGAPAIGGKIKNGMIQIKKLSFTQEFEGEIPDFIRWNPRNTVLNITIGTWTPLKSFKNFPTKCYEMIILSDNVPNDFTTMPKNIKYKTISIHEGIYSLKGLTGIVDDLYIGSRDFEEFNSSNLTCKTIKLGSPHVKNLNNVPTTAMFTIMPGTKIENLTGHEKVTWKKLIAPEEILVKFANPDGKKLDETSDPSLVLHAIDFAPTPGNDIMNQSLAVGDYVLVCRLNNRRPPEMVIGNILKITGRIALIICKRPYQDDIDTININIINCYKIDPKLLFNNFKFKE